MFNNLVTHTIYTGGELPPSSARAYEYIVAGNGVFLRGENRFVRALIPIATLEIRGLMPLASEVTFHVPRIPASLLEQVLDDARSLRGHSGQLNEALYHFHHDGRRIHVQKPAQSATAARVTSAGDGGGDTILDLHSHGSMRAFWSTVDDADERGFRFYGVIGRVDTEPELKLRLGVYGYHLDLPLATLFTGESPVRDASARQSDQDDPIGRRSNE